MGRALGTEEAWLTQPFVATLLLCLSFLLPMCIRMSQTRPRGPYSGLSSLAQFGGLLLLRDQSLCQTSNVLTNKFREGSTATVLFLQGGVKPCNCSDRNTHTKTSLTAFAHPQASQQQLLFYSHPPSRSSHMVGDRLSPSQHQNAL